MAKTAPTGSVDMRKYKKKGDIVRKITTYVLERKCAFCGEKFVVAYPQKHAAKFCASNACHCKRERAKQKKSAA